MKTLHMKTFAYENISFTYEMFALCNFNEHKLLTTQHRNSQSENCVRPNL